MVISGFFVVYFFYHIPEVYSVDNYSIEKSE